MKTQVSHLQSFFTRCTSILLFLLIFGFRLALAQGPPPVSFQPPVTYNTGTLPTSVAMGDFNGDGKLDLAVSNECDGDPNCLQGNVSVLLGNGDGTFQAAVNYAAGFEPFSVAVGDFNGDGKLDLVVANFAGNTLSVFMGNGNGTFQAPLTVDLGPGTLPWSVTVGDLNHDGKLDLVISNYVNETAGVLLGNGNGTFQPAVFYRVGHAPDYVAVADLDGDGNPDLVAANSGGDNIGVLLGNGDGTFRAVVNYPTGFYPTWVAVADMNGDGKPDLLVSNAGGTGTVSVLLGNGDGSFRAAVNYVTGQYSYSVAVGDFNGDGKPDLAVANLEDSNLSLLLGNGDGTLQPAVNFNAGSQPAVSVVADFNGDGKLDLAVADDGAGLAILLNSTPASGPAVIITPAPNSTLTGSSVTFQWSSSSSATAYWIDVGNTLGGNQYYQSGSLPTSTLAATVNTLPIDGSTVYVALYSLIGGQWVHNSYTYTAFNAAAAKGVLITPAPGSMFTGSTVTFGWTAGSGATAYWLDIGSSAGGNQYYQSGNLGTVLTTTVSGLPTDGSVVYVTLYSLVGGQWLSNAYTYTAWNVSTAQGVLTTPPPGSTLTGSTVTFGWTAGVGVTAYWLDVGSALGGNQFYQSGNLGPVLTVTVHGLPTNNSTVYVTLWSQIGGQWYSTGYTYIAAPPVVSFLPAVQYAAGAGTWAVATADVNADGKADVAVANSADNNISVLLGKGDGTFEAAVNYATGQRPVSVAIGDFNGDGRLDLAVANYGSNTVSVFLGKGDGTFQAAVSYAAGTNPHSVAVGDFNGDGALDLAVANEGSSNVSVLLGKGDGTFRAAVNYGAGSHPLAVAVGDFNGDGNPDLAVANQQSNNVSVFLGNADGTFQAAVNYTAGATSNSIAVGDFNADGNVDLVVANLNIGISVHLGRGDGTFQPAVFYGAGAEPASVAVGDFNGDGKTDLAVANFTGTHVSVLAGKGNGSFRAPVNFGSGSLPNSVAVADFNGDGKPDLVVADVGGSGGVTILLNSTPY